MVEKGEQARQPVLLVVFFRTAAGNEPVRQWLKGLNRMDRKAVGSEFDDFLREENLLEAVEATATKRMIAFQIAKEMKRRRLTKSEMASLMRTSRPALERLLDPANPSVTLSTLERAASALGKKLKVELA